jgi:hypothetical protein
LKASRTTLSRLVPETFFGVASWSRYCWTRSWLAGARCYRARPDASRAPLRLGLELPPMTEIIFVVEEAPEGGLSARALGVSIFTQAETMAELHDRVRDAVRCHFETGSQPRLIRLHYVRDEVIAA